MGAFVLEHFVAGRAFRFSQADGVRCKQARRGNVPLPVVRLTFGLTTDVVPGDATQAALYHPHVGGAYLTT